MSGAEASSDAPGPDPEAIEHGRKLFAGPVTFVLGVASLDGLPPGDRPEVAFAGRSNVGKSTLINALTGRKGLARASAEPGRTRELNYFDVGEGALYLVDLPGFGYAKVSRSQAKAWMAMTRTFLRGRAALRRVFLLVDARRGLMGTDREIMDMLDQSAVVYQVVLTKSDKLRVGQADAVCEAVARDLVRRPASHPVVAVTSAEKGYGLAELRAEIAALAEPRTTLKPDGS